MILLWYHYVKKQDNTILLHFFLPISLLFSIPKRFLSVYSSVWWGFMYDYGWV